MGGLLRPTGPLGASPEAFELIAARFRALGDPSRLRILNVLMTGEQSVQALVESTGLEQSNVSRHLGVLRGAGIVERRADGTRGLYRIVDPSVKQVCAEVCRGISDKLTGDLSALQTYEI